MAPPQTVPALILFARGGFYFREELKVEKFITVAKRLVRYEEEAPRRANDPAIIIDVLRQNQAPKVYDLKTESMKFGDLVKTFARIKPYLGQPDIQIRVRTDVVDEKTSFDHTVSTTLKIQRQDTRDYYYVSAPWHDTTSTEQNSIRFNTALRFLFPGSAQKLIITIPEHRSFEIDPVPIAANREVQKLFAKVTKSDAVAIEGRSAQTIHVYQSMSPEPSITSHGPPQRTQDQTPNAYTLIGAGISPSEEDKIFDIARTAIQPKEKGTPLTSTIGPGQQKHSNPKIPLDSGAGQHTPTLAPRVFTTAEIDGILRHIERQKKTNTKLEQLIQGHEMRASRQDKTTADLIQRVSDQDHEIRTLKASVAQMTAAAVPHPATKILSSATLPLINAAVSSSKAKQVSMLASTTAPQPTPQALAKPESSKLGLSAPAQPSFQAATSPGQLEIAASKASQAPVETAISPKPSEVALVGPFIASQPANQAATIPDFVPDATVSTPVTADVDQQSNEKTSQKLKYCNLCLKSVNTKAEGEREVHAGECATSVSEFVDLSRSEAKALRSERRLNQQQASRLKRKRDVSQPDVHETGGQALGLTKHMKLDHQSRNISKPGDESDGGRITRSKKTRTTKAAGKEGGQDEVSLSKARGSKARTTAGGKEVPAPKPQGRKPRTKANEDEQLETEESENIVPKTKAKEATGSKTEKDRKGTGESGENTKTKRKRAARDEVEEMDEVEKERPRSYLKRD